MTQTVQSPEFREIHFGHQDSLEVGLLTQVAPENEIHGRSLSAVRRMGGALYQESHIEVKSCPEADQARMEYYTSIEEALATDKEYGSEMVVNKTISFEMSGGKVLSHDSKTPVSEMTENGIVCAEKKSKEDPRFVPQYTRSVHDHNNSLEVDAMARGERTYNTRLVVSPYPEEAAELTGHDYWGKNGYVPSLKRGFVQMYHVTEDGRVIAGSYSFEGSDKAHLHRVFKELGIEVAEDASTDEWLQFPLTDTFNDEQAIELAKNMAEMCNQKIDKDGSKKSRDTIDITAKHRALIDRVFYENYAQIAVPTVTGVQTQELRDVIKSYYLRSEHFNTDYQIALDEMMNKSTFDDEDAIVMHELLVYSTIEMLRSLEFDRTAETQRIMYEMSPDQLEAIDRIKLQEMLSGFGGHGAKNKRVYSACGNSINLGSNEATDALDDANPQEVFGGRFRKRRDRFGSLKFKCPKGHENEREPGKLLPECKVCGTDVSCGKVKKEVKKDPPAKIDTTDLLKAILNIKKTKDGKIDLLTFTSPN